MTDYKLRVSCDGIQHLLFTIYKGCDHNTLSPRYKFCHVYSVKRTSVNLSTTFTMYYVWILDFLCFDSNASNERLLLEMYIGHQNLPYLCNIGKLVFCLLIPDDLTIYSLYNLFCCGPGYADVVLSWLVCLLYTSDLTRYNLYQM